MLEGRFGTLPVLDAHGSVAGMLTDRDIAMAAGTRQRNASHIGVHEAMSAKVRSCSPDDEVGATLKRMAEFRLRRLPVLTDTRQLIGILSIDDILLRAVDRCDGVSSAEFVQAMRQICARPSVEPDVNFSDTVVSG
jgi:CBS-domain-containing membrane protein